MFGSFGDNRMRCLVAGCADLLAHRAGSNGRRSQVHGRELRPRYGRARLAAADARAGPNPQESKAVPAGQENSVRRSVTGANNRTNNSRLLVKALA